MSWNLNRNRSLGISRSIPISRSMNICRSRRWSRELFAGDDGSG